MLYMDIMSIVVKNVVIHQKKNKNKNKQTVKFGNAAVLKRCQNKQIWNDMGIELQ